MLYPFRIQLILFLLLSIASQLIYGQEPSGNERNIIFQKNGISSIYIDQSEKDVVKNVVSLLQQDVKAVFNARLDITSSKPQEAQLVAGTIGVSEVISELADKGLLDLSMIENKWEAYLIQRVTLNGKQVLLIAGSDSRATSYGLLEISRLIGVSPWVWWADVAPAKLDAFSVPDDFVLQNAPKVKYRGVFLNDEDWGLQPWAAKTFEPEVGDIGPKTYEKIFQLLLRLRANTIWPAMHPSTKAFYTIPGNQEMAARYQIYIGTSHAEPMLRNNVGEWNHDKFGEYNYVTNSDMVEKYWQGRIEELKREDQYIITLGMRGIHDSGMQGHLSSEQKVALLETIISDQRELLKNTLNLEANTIPQAFVPYKEVLEIYSDGAKIPDDVTLVWPDDNHGYIRRLSDTQERKRPGGAGVYYHISYWGAPHDYLWLESTPVSLIWEEMNKAYETSARTIWIVNVGDIKSNEIGMNFFLDMAWDPSRFSPETLSSYYYEFAARQFGLEWEKEIGKILQTYFQLGYSRKPEHMGWNEVYPNTPIQDPGLSLFQNGDEVQQRIDAYTKLEERVIMLQAKMPESLQAAFYQLVVYKVLGASYINKKLLYAYKSRIYATQGRASSHLYGEKAQEALQGIKEVTEHYNQLKEGKWNQMMTYDPRKLAVFDMPETGQVERYQNNGGVIIEGTSMPLATGNTRVLPTFISATDRKYFVDIFNKGREPISWTAETKDPWVNISSNGNILEMEERIWVSVDWSKIPDGSNQTSVISFKVDNSEYNVQLVAKKVGFSGEKLFVEDNGVISIEAESFGENQNSDHARWQMIQGLGRQNDAVGSFPVTSGSLDISNPQSPSLTYEFVNESVGEANLRFYCLPSQPLNADYSLRFAVTIDNGAPIILNAALDEDMNEHQQDWRINVLRAINIVETNITIPEKGKHVLKIRMIDPAVVLDKLEVKFGDQNVGYFGRKETKGG